MTKRWNGWVSASLFFLFASVAPAIASDPMADLPVALGPPGLSTQMTVKEMKKKFPIRPIKVQDIVYKKEKTYEGFPLVEVLKKMGMGEAQGDTVAFRCADGYVAKVSLAMVKKGKPVLAFRELGKPGFPEKVVQGKAELSPAPLYLVWGKFNKAENEQEPWAYQIIGIEMVHQAEKYGRLEPVGAAKDSAERRGHQTFLNQCVHCHSVNLQGGDVGPELNYPKNITEYWDEDHILGFIQDPSSYRAKSKMAGLPKLKPTEYEDVVSYLKWMKNHKKSE